MNTFADRLFTLSATKDRSLWGRGAMSGLVLIAPSDTILGHTSPEGAWQRQAAPTQALLGL